MKLIGAEGWLCTCMMTFRYIDNAVTNVDIVKSGFVVAVLIFKLSAGTGILIYQITFLTVC